MFASLHATIICMFNFIICLILLNARIRNRAEMTSNVYHVIMRLSTILIFTDENRLIYLQKRSASYFGNTFGNSASNLLHTSSPFSC